MSTSAKSAELIVLLKALVPSTSAVDEQNRQRLRERADEKSSPLLPAHEVPSHPQQRFLELVQ